MRLLSLSEVSIQKRTSPGKLGKRDFEISFANVQFLAIEMAGQCTFQLRSWPPLPLGSRSFCGRRCPGLLIQMPGPGKRQRKFRSPEFPISRGSFSSVSTLLIARVGAFFSIIFFKIYKKIIFSRANFANFANNFCKILAKFSKFLILEWSKRMHIL